MFTSALNSVAPKAFPSEKRGKKAVKEKNVIQAAPEGSSTLEGKLETYVLAKDFLYLEFIDKELMTPTLLKHLRVNDDNLADKFQWIGHLLLKSAVVIRYSEPVISSRVRAIEKVKDLKERITLL